METTNPGERVNPGSQRRPKAVVFGNRIAPYHPLGPVEPAFRAIFGSAFDLRFTEDTRELATELEDVQLVIGYADTWETAMSDAAAVGLVGYVAGGGGLLVLHNGVSWSKHPRVLPLLGAAFTGHPDQTVLSYRLSGTHPIAAGHESFAFQEEPYRYAFVPGYSAEVFLRYEYDGRAWEAGWACTHGAGRVAVLQPGHRPAAFENPSYAALTRQAALWCSHLRLT